MLLSVTQQTDSTVSLTTYLPVLITLLIINGWVLWRRYRSRSVLLQRVVELEELSQAGSAIVAAQLDFAALCDLIVAETDKIIDTRTFQLGFFDGDLYQIQAWMIDGEHRKPRTFDLSEDSGLIGWVRQSKQPLLVYNLENELATLPAKPRNVEESPASFIFIPLVSGEEAIGILGAYSNEPNQFSQKQLRQLTILANQAAAAIGSARLYEAERRRAAQIELIGRITHHISGTQDLVDLFSQVVSLTQETFGYHQVNIYLLNREQDYLVLKASSSSDISSEKLRVGSEEGLVGAAVSQQKMLVNNSLPTGSKESINFGILDLTESPSQVQAAVASPLLVQDKVWGTLEVLSGETNIFTQQEQEVIRALTSGIEIAIQKAEQVRQQREQAWLTTARLQVAEAIGRSEQLDDMLENLVRLIPILTGFEECGFLLWDEEKGHYFGHTIQGATTKDSERFRNGHWSIGTWGALDAAHVGQETISTTLMPPWMTQRPRSTSHTLFPLIADASGVGMLVVHEKDQNLRPSDTYLHPLDNPEFTKGIELLQDMASQTAQAIERQSLRQAQEEEAWVNTALLQVAGAVNSLIDLNEILNTIVRFVPMLIGVQSCLILIWDEERNHYTTGPSYGITEMGRGILETLEMSQRELQEMLVREDTHTVQGDSVQQYDLRLQPWLKRVLNVQNARVIPLWAQQRRVGIMLVGLLETDPLINIRRQNILLGIAQQAATALVNNQLYKESAERDRLEQELNVARKIQASLIPPGSPKIEHCDVASVWQAARQVSGDFYDFMQVKNGNWAFIIADVADKGVPAAIFMAVSRTILRAVANSRDNPATILERANQLILNDSNSDLFVTVFIGVWEPAKRMLHYACGGHNPPLLFKKNGAASELKARGMALGVIKEAVFELNAVKLERNDVVLFYTDGITEAINEDYDEFGLDRLKWAVRQHKAEKAENIIAAISTAVQDHAGHMPQFDDITMIVMKCCT